MPLIGAERLREFATRLLAAAGAGEEEARIVAASLVDAALCGYDSHGVMRIPFYIEDLKRGHTVAGAALRIVAESPVHLVADGQWGFGRVQAGRVMDQLIPRAEALGVAAGTLTQASHIGRLGEYCELAAARGLASIVMANTHGATRRIAPPGGKSPCLGTNPMALGVPVDDAPIILDFSTSATAEGKVRVKKIAGQACPEGWLLDCEGNPTTDPNTLYADPPGSILPMGGAQAYKGFGLALLIDLFAGALSGGVCGRETPITPKGNCAFFMLVSPERFGGQEHFRAEASRLVSFVRNSPRRAGVDQILLPGDPERRLRAERMRTGIPIDAQNWQPLAEAAARWGVPLPIYEAIGP